VCLKEGLVIGKNYDIQFELQPRKRTDDTIIAVCHVQDKHDNIGTELCYAFVDVEKAFDRVARSVATSY